MGNGTAPPPTPWPPRAPCPCTFPCCTPCPRGSGGATGDADTSTAPPPLPCRRALLRGGAAGTGGTGWDTTPLTSLSLPLPLSLSLPTPAPLLPTRDLLRDTCRDAGSGGAGGDAPPLRCPRNDCAAPSCTFGGRPRGRRTVPGGALRLAAACSLALIMRATYTLASTPAGLRASHVVVSSPKDRALRPRGSRSPFSRRCCASVRPTRAPGTTGSRGRPRPRLGATPGSSTGAAATLC
jgi:hypothetical protein